MEGLSFMAHVGFESLDSGTSIFDTDTELDLIGTTMPSGRLIFFGSPTARCNSTDFNSDRVTSNRLYTSGSAGGGGGGGGGGDGGAGIADCGSGGSGGGGGGGGFAEPEEPGTNELDGLGMVKPEGPWNDGSEGP